jgi:8-oxo-dGTP diphosphatase
VNTSTNHKTDSAAKLICTVDVVLLTLQEGELQVLLVKREREPFANALALPGGYVHPQEDQSCLEAAQRVLQSKTGLQSPYLEQLGSFSGPGRDPRGWSISVAYFALVPPEALPSPQAGCEWRAVEGLPALPFDHASILASAVDRVRSKSQYSSLPAHFCSEPFTLPQLHAVYAAVMGESINAVSFRRKMEELDFLEAIEGAKSSGGAHRPAQLYRLKEAYRLRLKLAGRGLNA